MKMAYAMLQRRIKAVIQMLKLNKSLCLRLLCVLLVVFMCSDHVWAYSVKTVASNISSKWYATDKNGANVPGGGNFVLDGGIGKVKHGSYGDEYALMGLVAVQIVEHGGYFCPKQIQCTNKSGKNWSDMVFYDLEGFSNEKCLWLCESGYTGVACAEHVAITPAMTTPVDQVFSGVSMRTSGKRLGDTGAGISVFHAWTADRDRDRMILLGLIDVLEHGGLALPIYLSCYEEGGSSNISYISNMKVYPNVKPKLLCAEGYMANSAGTACELVTAAALEVRTIVKDSQKSFCIDWDETKYDPNVHELDLTGTCIRFLCRDRTKAFPAKGDFSCVECVNSIRGGQHSKTGECVKCDQLGTFFDQNSNTCKTAIGYSHLDLLYGKGRNKLSYKNNLNGQCWAKTSPDEYRECVTGKKVVQETE